MDSRILSVGIFVALMLSSLLAGRQGYLGAKEEITADLNQALLRMVEERQGNIVTQDSIRAYKRLRQVSDGEVWLAIADRKLCRNLKNRKLKDKTFLSFNIVDEVCSGNFPESDMISSDTLIVNHKATGTTLAVRSYTRLSAIWIFRMSDQRWSSLLAFVALLWAIGSMLRMRKKNVSGEVSSYGGLFYSSANECFYDAHHVSIDFTPMQHQLMRMLWHAPSHSMSKEAICATLWPKKTDANNTLYTLVRRLKPILETCSELQIVAHRGRSYSLEIKKKTECQDNVRKMSASFFTER